MKTLHVEAKNLLSSKQLKNIPHFVVALSENFNKQFFNCIVKMVLSDEKTLEALVADNETDSEIELAIKEVKEELADKVEDVADFVEQPIDAEAFNDVSYSIETPYEFSSYSGEKSYYELSKEGSAEFSYEAYEHEFLQAVQEIASSTKQGDGNNNPFVEAQIDCNLRDKKDAIKMVSNTLWQMMYDGKIIFN